MTGGLFFSFFDEIQRAYLCLVDNGRHVSMKLMSMTLGYLSLVVFFVSENFYTSQCAQYSYLSNQYTLEKGKSLLSIPYSSLNQISLGDNDVVKLNLPWGGFPYFNGIYESAYLSSNGVLSFADEPSMSSLSLPKLTVHENPVPIRDMIIVLHRHLTATHMYSLSTVVRNRHLDRTDPAFRVHILHELPNLRMIVIKNPSHGALSYLRNHPYVSSVENDEEVSVLDAVDDERGRSFLRRGAASDRARQLTSNPYSWGLDRCDQHDLPLDENTFDPGESTKYGSGVDVYVLDTGIMTSHIEFQSVSPRGRREVRNVWDGYIPDATNPDADNDLHGMSSLPCLVAVS